ncbi:MAG TPA: patatin-like phospholipase family protein [Xanthobacteraceae bacterium]|nr:patatin-like phospholipase family protein [Xanthobacteraceae bacterium]
MFDAISFAGGGNRCYWQGGFYEAASERLNLTAPRMVAASAGAFACIYSLLGLGARVRALVYSGCGPQVKNFDFAAWREGKPLCPVGGLYRALIDEVIDGPALNRLKGITDLSVAVTRLPRFLPPLLGAAIGISAYQIEKRLFHPVHPRFGRALGFRQEFVRVRDMASPAALGDLLIASSCVPPFMPITNIGGVPAFDGGLVDNVPVAPIEAIEQAGGRTLVLLTRKYKHVPRIANRTYAQPSEPVRVKQFDVTNPAGMRAAYELGLKDGVAFARARAN